MILFPAKVRFFVLFWWLLKKQVFTIVSSDFFIERFDLFGGFSSNSLRVWSYACVLNSDVAFLLLDFGLVAIKFRFCGFRVFMVWFDFWCLGFRFLYIRRRMVFIYLFLMNSGNCACLSTCWDLIRLNWYNLNQIAVMSGSINFYFYFGFWKPIIFSIYNFESFLFPSLFIKRWLMPLRLPIMIRVGEFTP